MTALLAAGGAIDYGVVLRDLAVILLVAKIASELSERVGVPAVIGEITAGILIGPSLLGLVGSTDATKVLAEIGVVVLLATVGMETDLDELRRVGRASMTVAVVGVVVPMMIGIGAGGLLGESGNASLFLGAALAATSVGITARVFGDLHALASREARIVLGAAVADDVLGLVILTVVTRVVEQGSVDVTGVLGTVGLALGFLVVAGAVGVLLVPRIVALVGSRANSAATVGVLAAALTFGFSAAASSAKLAPIIGAFVAGAALGRTVHHERIARDLTALGNVFVPVFFLQIGIDTEIGRFLEPHVLWVAAVLSVVAVGGKVVAGWFAGRGVDRLLVGLGMVPRGEVGLIFATIGLNVGVFDDDLYAVVLLVVLVSTVVAPPLLRRRLSGGPTGSVAESTPRPEGGWFTRDDDMLELSGVPAERDTLLVSLEAALEADSRKPGPALLAWMDARRDVPLAFDGDSTDRFADLLAKAGPGAWRFLELAGVVERAIPEYARAIATRRPESSELNPAHEAGLACVEAVRRRVSRSVEGADDLLLAAFLSDIDVDAQSAAAVLHRFVLPEGTAASVAALLLAARLMTAAALTGSVGDDRRAVSQIADYLGSPAAVERCRLLAEARTEFADWQYAALLEIAGGVQELLAHPELLAGRGGSVESLRRNEAMDSVEDTDVRGRIQHAATSFVLSRDVATIVRHARMVEPAPLQRRARVSVQPTSSPDLWNVEIATRDTKGLLARIAGVLAERGLDIVSADLATWPDDAVLDVFTVRSIARPSAEMIVFDLERSLRGAIPEPRRLGQGGTLRLEMDNGAHPWHTVISLSGPDQPGLLRNVAAAMARANVRVHHARVSTVDGGVSDRFEVSDRHGRKISEHAFGRIRGALS